MIVYNIEKNRILTEEEYQNNKGYLDYDELNGERVIVYIPFSEEQLLEQRIEELRQLRTPLLQAFDIYKSNVNYGIETDNSREEIIMWYKAILDLDEKAISNPPIEIRRYM